MAVNVTHVSKDVIYLDRTKYLSCPYNENEWAIKLAMKYYQQYKNAHYENIETASLQWVFNYNEKTYVQLGRVKYYDFLFEQLALNRDEWKNFANWLADTKNPHLKELYFYHDYVVYKMCGLKTVDQITDSPVLSGCLGLSLLVYDKAGQYLVSTGNFDGVFGKYYPGYLCAAEDKDIKLHSGTTCTGIVTTIDLSKNDPIISAALNAFSTRFSGLNLDKKNLRFTQIAVDEDKKQLVACVIGRFDSVFSGYMYQIQHLWGINSYRLVNKDMLDVILNDKLTPISQCQIRNEYEFPE